MFLLFYNKIISCPSDIFGDDITRKEEKFKMVNVIFQCNKTKKFT